MLTKHASLIFIRKMWSIDFNRFWTPITKSTEIAYLGYNHYGSA